MKRRASQLLSILLVFVMALMLLPGTAFADGSPFSDVAGNAWYYDAVKYVYENGIMSGTGGGKFSPNTDFTRAQMCQVLYNMEGLPNTEGFTFSDVAQSAWYYNAVSWAANHDIVGGVGNGRFNPDGLVSREQTVAILYRYSTYKGYNTTNTANLSGFSDAGQVSGWAETAMRWAVGEGLLRGVTDTTIVPGGSSNRATVATVMMRFCQRYGEPDVTDNHIPANEYERGVWYGFLPKELTGAKPDKTVTWRQFCSMLGNMIERYDASVLPEWEQMTAKAPDDVITRDGAAIALLFAGKVLGWDYFTRSPDELYDESYSAGHHVARDYPIFDWESPFYLQPGNETFDNSNAVMPAFWYLMGRVSVITYEPMLTIGEGGDPHLEDPLTKYDALIAVVRLYESCEDAVLDTAERLLALVLETEEGARIVAEAEALKRQILNSETAIVKSDTFVQGETYTGTAYYVSNNGDDANDGLSPEKAWATLERLGSAPLAFGDAVFFERGSLWRNAVMPDNVKQTDGLTLSAYGRGEKPVFSGSPENGAGAEKWELYYEGPNGEKIWKFYQDMTDCSGIILNEDEIVKRNIAYFDGKGFVCIDREDFSVPYTVENELPDMRLFCALPYTMPPIPMGQEQNFYWGQLIYEDQSGKYLTGPLYFRCDAGNPGALYGEIEFIGLCAPFDGMPDYTTLDNLCFRYSNTTGGGYVDGVSKDHQIIQYCETGWMGGHLKYFQERMPHIFIDGGGFNVNGSYETIRYCYTHHCFQEGVSFETFNGDLEPSVGNVLENNLVEYCLMGLTNINWEDSYDSVHTVSDMRIENNYVLYSGFENLYCQDVPLHDPELQGGVHWPARSGYVIQDSAVLTVRRGGENVRITGNTFAFSASQLIRCHAGEPTDPKQFEHYIAGEQMETPIRYEGNTYAPLPGFVALCTMVFGSGPRELELDAQAAISDILHDGTGRLITFD